MLSLPDRWLPACSAVQKAEALALFQWLLCLTGHVLGLHSSSPAASHTCR